MPRRLPHHRLLALIGLIFLLLLPGCRVDDRSTLLGSDDAAYTYFMVTHGPTTDVGFWGDVFQGTLAKAEQLGVAVIPLHPVIAASGELLNAQMRQAIAARPPGIIATIWGEGMPDVVKQANALGIPIAAINVYPDPSQYGPGKAEFLLYSGQNDVIVGVDGATALICSSAGKRLTNGDCEGTSPQTLFNALQGTDTVAVVCMIHQQSAGVISRCASAQTTFIDTYGLPASQFYPLSWDEAVPGDNVAKIQAFFNDPAVSGYSRFLIFANGPNTIDAYKTASIPDRIRAAAVIGVFNTSSAVCQALANREIAWASGQGQKEQGKMALDYLHYYVHHRTLPPLGQAPDGSADPRWIQSPDGYYWYKTGPEMFYDRCP